MYCGKCGKKIDDHAGFCPFCGNATGSTSQQNVSNIPVGISGMQRIAGGVSISIWIILDFAFFIVCFLHLESNMDAFDWVSSTSKMLGILLYFAIAVSALPDCIKTIGKVAAGKHDQSSLIANGISTIICALFLQIGRWIFNDWSDNDMSIVFYRIFGTYKGMVVPLVLASIVFFTFAFLLAADKGKKYR